jgi:hypothetical protein
MSNSENGSPSPTAGLDAFAEELGDDIANINATKDSSESDDSEVVDKTTESTNMDNDLGVDVDYSDSKVDVDSEDDIDSALTDLDSVTETATLEVYSKKCLECKTLISWAIKEFKSCHFTNGNADCPGASVAVVVKVPQAKVDDAANKIITATKNQDTVRLANIYAQLAERSEWVRSKVFERVKELQNR